MRYKALITQINYGSIIIDATHVNEAIKKAEKMYDGRNVHWKTTTHEIQVICLDECSRKF